MCGHTNLPDYCFAPAKCVRRKLGLAVLHKMFLEGGHVEHAALCMRLLLIRILWTSVSKQTWVVEGRLLPLSEVSELANKTWRLVNKTDLKQCQSRACTGLYLLVSPKPDSQHRCGKRQLHDEPLAQVVPDEYWNDTSEFTMLLLTMHRSF